MYCKFFIRLQVLKSVQLWLQFENVYYCISHHHTPFQHVKWAQTALILFEIDNKCVIIITQYYN